MLSVVFSVFFTIAASVHSEQLNNVGFEIALSYTKERKQFNQSISSFQSVLFKLAVMAGKVIASRTLLRQAASLVLDQSHPFASAHQLRNSLLIMDLKFALMRCSYSEAMVSVVVDIITTALLNNYYDYLPYLLLLCQPYLLLFDYSSTFIIYIFNSVVLYSSQVGSRYQ